MSPRLHAGTATLGFIALLLALVACSTRRDEAPSARPATDSATPPRAIFREIDIRPFGKVTLGAPFTQRAPTAVAIGPGMFALVADGGHFANTDSILVRVDGENRVRALSFVYQAGTEYDAGVTEYQGSLGIPVSRTVVDSAGGKLDRAVWEDERTRFELTRYVAAGTPPRVASTLLDRSR